jgi:transaldolase
MLFIDSSDVNEISKYARWGVFSGITTNPKILASDGIVGKKSLKDVVMDLTRFHLPVSVEITETELSKMLAQAKEFFSWDDHIVVKVPHTEEGLMLLNQNHGAKFNMTVMMNFNQCYLAALAGAVYVSLFFGRIEDMGYDPRTVIRDVRTVLDLQGLKSKIIVGSVRSPIDVQEALLAGAHIVTVTPKVLAKMTWNPQTDLTIAEFNKSWQSLVDILPLPAPVEPPKSST